MTRPFLSRFHICIICVVLCGACFALSIRNRQQQKTRSVFDDATPLIPIHIAHSTEFVEFAPSPNQGNHGLLSSKSLVVPPTKVKVKRVRVRNSLVSFGALEHICECLNPDEIIFTDCNLVPENIIELSRMSHVKHVLFVGGNMDSVLAMSLLKMKNVKTMEILTKTPIDYDVRLLLVTGLPDVKISF